VNVPAVIVCVVVEVAMAEAAEAKIPDEPTPSTSSVIPVHEMFDDVASSNQSNVRAVIFNIQT
jgi:hypothetical protein